MVIEASAPGKVILFGEHFVVKGKPAIALALDLRVNVRVDSSNTNTITIYSHNTNSKLEIELGSLKTSGSENLVQLHKIVEVLSSKAKLKPAYIEINSNIPIAAGLGSSASLAVAFTAAYSKFIGLELTREEISRIAFEAEKIVHGKPSGIDNTIATYGGAILYKAGEFSRIKLSNIQSVSLIIADTGITRSTRKAVLRVLELYNKYPEILSLIYDAAERIVVRALGALENGSWPIVGELMNLNHGLLSTIGVSTLELEELVFTARRAGALGAKITGAGMGGSIIALAYSANSSRIAGALREKSKRVIVAGIDSRGLVIRS